MTELNQDEIYERMQKYWNEANDLHKMASMAHLALPEANAIVNHAMEALDAMLANASVSVTLSNILGGTNDSDAMLELAKRVNHQKHGLFAYVFLSGYNMGKAGDELMKVPAGCEHNSGMEN